MTEQSNLRLVAANVQRLHDDRKRIELFNHYSKTKGDMFLISETGRPSPGQVIQWKQECENFGLSALFFPLNNTAILWRPSIHVKLHSDVSINQISSLLDRPDHSCDALFDLGDLTVRIFSIYSPCHGQQGKTFISNLSHHLPPPSATTLPTLLGGDWNCVIDPKLDSTNPLGSNIGGAELRNLLLSHTLSDSYRQIYPRKQFFSNSGTNGTDRRLDYIFLCPHLKNLVQRCQSWQARDSTHVPIVVDLAIPGLTPTGPGSFKFGLHHLKREGMPEYLQGLTARLHALSTEAFPQDKLAAWDKTKISLQVHLSDLSRSMAKMDRKASEESRERKSQAGAVLRARLNQDHAGKSSVFIRLRQVRQADLLPSLKVGETVFSKPDDIVREAREYCANLYLPKEVCQLALDNLLSQLDKKIPHNLAKELEKDYSEEDLLAAANKCSKDATPGPDGLPVEFYLATWPVTGPILTELINIIPSSDINHRKPSRSHGHVLHKKGDRDQMGNKRIINVNNSDKRIQSQAHNMRLAPCLPTFLNPTQTGFIPGRWIGYNIAEVQAAMDSDKSDGYLAVMDFEKAYDRISHDYLIRILDVYGLGPRFQKWAQDTFLNAESCLLINGWLSAPFRILSGVRQGDPLSPSLFAICIEGFATLIRKQVQGIQSPFLPALRELLFADDTLAGLKDHTDLLSLESATKTYEKASGSKLSIIKSFLYPLGSYRINPPKLLNGWRIEMEPFRYLGITVGIGVDPEKEWAVIAEKAMKRMRSIPMFDLPIATRCAIINIYCFSKVLYFDQFLPAPESIIDQLTTAAQQAIWGQKRPLSSLDRLCTPLDRGGWGLADLKLQLQGPRAHWIFRLLQKSSFTTRHLLQIKGTLMECLLKKEFIKTTFNTTTLQRTKTIFTWNGIFCQPGTFNARWDQATYTLKLLLPPRWITYLAAWNDLLEIPPAVGGKWDLKVLDPKWNTLNRSIPCSFFITPQQTPLSANFFGRESRLALLKREYPSIGPASWRTRFPSITTDQWRNWWPFLRKVRRRYPEAENSAHLLSLNSLHPGARLGGNPDSQFIHNRSTSCVLCGEDQLEDLEHLLVDCTFSQQVWSILEPATPHPSLCTLVCPSRVHKSLLKEISIRIIFLHRIFRLSRSRRFQELPLEPLLAEHAEEVAKEISSHHASPVSSSFDISAHSSFSRVF
jgi:hypothetical protein